MWDSRSRFVLVMHIRTASLNQSGPAFYIWADCVIVLILVFAPDVQHQAAKMSEFRVEQDTMGPVNVPIHALYTAQTQRAVDNFPFGHPFTPRLITAMAQVKKACATANLQLGLMTPDMTAAIHTSVDAIVNDFESYKNQFPISIFQTGSGTSTNMNLNEVIATLATR